LRNTNNTLEIFASITKNISFINHYVFLDWIMNFFVLRKSQLQHILLAKIFCFCLIILEIVDVV